jgi:transposase
VISGIVHVLMSGGRWVDAPAVYGPKKTLYNRWVWRRAFEELAAAGGPAAEIMLDSTHAKAHRCAAGGQGGLSPRPSAARAVVEPPKSMPW